MICKPGLKEENETLREQLAEAKAKEMNEEGLDLMSEIEDLERRKASLNRNLAQAKTTIMDAAGFMGKMKSKDDKIDALSREVNKWKTLAGIPDHPGETNSPSASAPEPQRPSTPREAAKSTAPDTSHGSRSFGRGVPPPRPSSTSSRAGNSGHLQKNSNTGSKVVPKGDSRSKFAKSLFGNVKDKKTSK